MIFWKQWLSTHISQTLCSDNLVISVIDIECRSTPNTKAKGTRKQIPCDCNKCFFSCHRTKLCFRVRMAKLMQQKLLEQNQLRFLSSYFSRWQPWTKSHRDNICSPSFQWRRANQKEKTNTNYLDKAQDATQKN